MENESFDEMANAIMYNHWYYIAIVINFLFMYKTLIKPILKEKILYGRELILIISWSVINVSPIINESLAIIFFIYGMIGGLDLIEKKVILKFK